MADQAIVEISCTKLRSAIGDEATNFTGDLQEMLDTLVAIQAVMPNAERVLGGWESEPGKEWAKKVRAAAYGVSDLVDEVKLQAARSPAAGKMTKKVDLPAENKMSDKVKEIKENLKGVLKESIEFNAVRARSRAPNPVTTVPPGAIVGRDEDRGKILAHISARCATEGPIILLISGEGGVGKTTMAEMLFNDTRFRCHSRVWVHTSRFLHEIGRSVICQVSGKDEMSHASEDDVDMITDRLHELLSGIKVLIVLDDLYMYNYEWEPLKRMFSVSDKGSQVIVIATTEQEREDSVIQSHSLEPLTEDMCCTLIKQIASRHFEDSRSSREELERMARKIAELCKGLPLAAQLLGRLLRFKHFEEWPALLDESLWSTDSPVDLALELSYRSMPPNLRLCLAYCTISHMPPFLVKEDVIHQWIALGLIEPSHNTISAMKLAGEYIGRLLDMSFLQTANLQQDSGKDDTGVVLFKMHESIRDFGHKAIEAEMGYIDDPEYNNVTEHCRYVVIDECDTWPSKSLVPAHKICAINCFSCSKMELSDDSFSVPSCLRVLNLAKTSIQKLPHSIRHLEQLGYLNLSGCSRLVDLPEIFGNLKNLLHINLSGCSELVNLPESFGMLKILRHINLSGCSGLVTLGEPFVKLTSLVHINLSGCCALINLPEFFGKLVNLMHLNLSGCSSLVALPGSFGKLIKLVHISLSGCSGLKKLPQSFGSLTSLVHINLSGCSSLSTLPNSIGYLRNLLHIDLSRCYGLSKLPKSFGKLQKLEHIGLSGCSGLVTLPESFGGLINLLHINLSHCSGLSKLPESFRNLRNLVYLDLSFWSCFEGIQIALGGLTSLQHLNLSHPCCYRADHIHLEGLKEVFHKLNRLQYLNLSMLLNPISYNQSEEKICEYIESISGLYSLEHLDLSHNIFLRDLPESLSDLYRLHTLDLSGCIRLKRLGKWMAKMDSLKSIILRDCEGLESYQFEVGVDDSINNYVQLEDVTSKVLEIRCLERIKCLEEAERIKLVEKRKLQKLKLCWTVDPKSSTSVNDNKSEVSAEENKPNRSMEENISDTSMEENEHKDLVQDNKPDRSEEENKPEGFVQENKPDKSKEENILDRSTEENEPKGSTHENKPKSSVQENTPKKSEKESIPDRSVEEIEHEGPVQVNIVNKSKEENIHDKYVEEIIEDGGSVQDNKPDSSEVENKPDKSVEEIVLEDYVHENKLNSSEKENKPGRSLEETVLEGSVQENKPNKHEEENINIPDKSVEEIVRAGSEEENKPDRFVDEIDYFYGYRRPNSSLREDKPDGVVEENVLLGALVPPQNLQCLELHGYSGETCRPCWWTEKRCSANLPNLVEVTMENFPSCRTLPPFGMLPNLQQLVLRRMASITRINASDLSGSKNNRLKCTIDDMPSLEEFNTTYIRGDKKSTFSAIEELVVQNCPLVRFGTLPPRARRLVISECEKGMDFLGEKQEGHEEEGPSCTSAPITELVVKNCSKPLYQWSLLNHLSILPSLTIENCSLLELCSLDNDDDNSVPEYLGYLTSLPELKIVSCEDVDYQLLRWIIQKLASLKSLHFIDCKDLWELPKELGDLTSLQKLAFERCPRIDSLPYSISKLTNLKDLHISDCPRLKRWCENKENKSRLGHLRTKI
ncbi:hypothetical protein GQ55_2G053500 [Panicum hallii var. hallii]|uniref:AAA+ ATPase domain-containing protein n=1 Tax=Panicum hallii var. hallii TaxID=1504633 RepID=A0A2T7ELN2_9POAL|nr:hypothetical protein GQ55_2G053500 [Panicum hallii var. hallii]